MVIAEGVSWNATIHLLIQFGMWKQSRKAPTPSFDHQTIFSPFSSEVLLRTFVVNDFHTSFTGFAPHISGQVQDFLEAQDGYKLRYT